MSNNHFLFSAFQDLEDSVNLTGSSGNARSSGSSFTNMLSSAGLRGGTSISNGLPSVNPNAVDNNRLVESFPNRSTWKYQPGNRSFIKQMPIYYPQNHLNHSETNTQPINVRLIDSYLQAVEDTRIRKQMGVDYTP